MGVFSPVRTIALAGPMGSGKSTLARELGRRSGMPVLSFGGLVRAEASRRGLGDDRPTLQDLGAALVASLGPEEFVDMLLRGVDHGPVVVDGVRHVAINQALRRSRPDALLIYVTAGEAELDSRWRRRGDAGLRPSAAEHVVESELLQLREVAGISLDSGQLSVDDLTEVTLAAATSPAP
ncbi:MAG: AAA family ATPase [Actinomycetales bacterium]